MRLQLITLCKRIFLYIFSELYYPWPFGNWVGIRWILFHVWICTWMKTIGLELITSNLHNVHFVDWIKEFLLLNKLENFWNKWLAYLYNYKNWLLQHWRSPASGMLWRISILLTIHKYRDNWFGWPFYCA